MDLDRLQERLSERYAHEPEFLQTVGRTLREIAPLAESEPELLTETLVSRILEPDRLIQFRVDWEDDDGNFRSNRGYRVQWNDALGPYKGGLRFHSSVNPSVLKFLAFEQTFKNALTGLNLGGGKGGSDFSTRDRSEREIRRFCAAFVAELHRHVGRELDVPAGDIGVGSREVGFMYGQFKRYHSDAAEALTGKPIVLGGSALREEATGWGVVYFARCMLERNESSLEGLACAVSGAGNVAVHTANKLIEYGARVITLSDSGGFVHHEKGFSSAEIERVEEVKREGGRLKDFAQETRLDYADGRAWQVKCDAAFPCATQNELEEADAESLIEKGCRLVCEGANMPTTEAAEALLHDADVLFGPSKAANAGGVAVSEFEMAQAASRQRWDPEKVDERLREVMQHIHARCVEFGQDGDRVDYAAGASRAGFVRVAEAMSHF